MANTSGQADIRGLNVIKAIKGYADEDIIFKRYVTVTAVSNKKTRWYQKTAGFLTTPTTSGIASEETLILSDDLAMPVVAEQSWTRQESTAKKWIMDSPMLAVEDMKDSDVPLLTTNIRDITRRIQYSVEKHIIEIITEDYTPSLINTGAATGTGWDDGTNGNPLKDIRAAKTGIRQNGYNPESAILAINSIEYENLRNYIVANGASFPSVSEDEVRNGVVTRIEGLRVVVSENVTTDYALVFVPKTSCTYLQFISLTGTTITEPGLGTKIRAWEEGVAILTDPKAVYLITDTVT